VLIFNSKETDAYYDVMNGVFSGNGYKKNSVADSRRVIVMYTAV
jgi:hypothetical protein